MKIGVVHQFYLLPGQGGGSRFNEFARLWSEAGHEVTVIAGALDTSTNEVPAEYKGKMATKVVEEHATVWRCYVPVSYNSGFLGRLWAFFGWTLSASITALRLARQDVVIATSPPLVASIPGWLWGRFRLRRSPIVFEIRDLWPESAVTTGVLSARSPLTRILYRLERWSYRHASKINVLTPAFRDDLLERRLAPAEKIVFVPNGADVDSFKPASRDNDARRSLGWGDRTVAVYAGAHGRANAVMQLVDAAQQLAHRPDILIASVGDGPERAAAESRARDLGLTNIVFHGAQPKERMPEIVNAADIGMAVLQNNPTFRTVYPNKVFDYMASARPTLLAIDGVARELVCEQADAGVFAEPENGVDLAAQIVRLADDPALRQRLGENGFRWVRANATRSALAERYLGILKDLSA